MTEGLPKRKAARLSKYDYSNNGYYFVTVCTRGKRSLFWKSVPTSSDDAVELFAEFGGRMISAPTVRPRVHLSVYGKMVDRAIQNIPLIYPDISVDTYVIMPDHIHMILVINDAEVLPKRGTPSPKLMRVVGQMKRWVSKNANASIWQKSFFDHVIRNYDDYVNTVTYIMCNPQKRINSP